MTVYKEACISKPVFWPLQVKGLKCIDPLQLQKHSIAIIRVGLSLAAQSCNYTTILNGADIIISTTEVPYEGHLNS